MAKGNYHDLMLATFLALGLTCSQTPPSAPVPPSPFVKSDDFSEAMQKKLLAGCPRLKSVQNDLGTATIVAIRDGSAYLLTARHVIKTYSEMSIDLFLPEERGLPVSIPKLDEIISSQLIDVALIKVSLKGLKKEQIQSLTVIPLPKPYDRPKQFPIKALSIGCDLGAAPTCQEESIIARQLVRRISEQAGAVYWHVEKPPVSGRSGGPLIDKKGRLIGVCVAQMGNSGYFAYLDEIHSFLKTDGFAWIWEGK